MPMERMDRRPSRSMPGRNRFSVEVRGEAVSLAFDTDEDLAVEVQELPDGGWMGLVVKADGTPYEDERGYGITASGP